MTRDPRPSPIPAILVLEDGRTMHGEAYGAVGMAFGEAVFSTGLGFSFAIPHSKSEHIEQSTISVARLPAPVTWGDEQAQFIIMLTLNKHAAGDQHMRIFSRLARRIMHEEFRHSLVNAASADAIASLLQHELEL